MLLDSFLVTLRVTLEALLAAVIGGVALAFVFAVVAHRRTLALPNRGDPAGHARWSRSRRCC